LNHLANARQERKEFGPMLAASERACALVEELARTYPETSRWKEMLAGNLRQLSRHQAAAKLPSRATAGRSAAIFEDLVKAYPGVDQFRVGLVEASIHECNLARADHDRVAARAAVRRAVDRSVELMQDPESKGALARAADCYLLLAIADIDENRLEDARRGLETAESMMRRFTQVEPWVEYDLACTLSLLSVHGRTSVERAALNDRAMDTLRLAVNHGFSNRGLVRDDPDMAPLRHRPEYRLVLLDLDFPQPPFSP
jgi:hypothetical protein